ncbi:MAG TPA: D-arabinono-1,4-lactone oxidase [Bdellovibrio sp.]|nr:D-arabinono-1,4-lactone oxidase [Bdellovibrio sp.]
MGKDKSTLGRREFLKSAAALGISSLAPAGVAHADEGLRDEFSRTNWAGNIIFKPERISAPSSWSDLKQVIRENRRVKMVGSRHSFNSIAAPEELWLSLKNFHVPLQINAQKNSVELPAGMSLNEANKQLQGFGLAFASIGEIDAQAIAGLTATSTHGTGMNWGTLSDTVQSMKVVTGSGELIEINGGETLAAARTHLGALGAVVSLTMSVTNAHNLERHLRFVALDEAIDPAFIRAHDHTEIYYLPFADKAYVKSMNVTNKSASGLAKKEVTELFKENLLLSMSLTAASLKPSLIPKLMKIMTGQFKDVTDIGPSAQMMTSIRTMRYHEMELAMDLDSVKEALAEVKEAIQDLAQRNAFYAHLPVSIRAVQGRPDNYLSPTQGRDTVYFSFTAHTAFENYPVYFKEMENRLVKKFGARPHWGKHFYTNPISRYSTFSQFEAVRKQLDPEGKFMNPFLEKLLAGKSERSFLYES